MLGSLLIDGAAIARVAPLVKPVDFYRDRNRWCYEACQALYERGEGIDQVNIARELAVREQLDGIGEPGHLSHLIAVVPTSVHVEHYARTVNQTATLRRLIGAGADIAALGYQALPIRRAR